MTPGRGSDRHSDSHSGTRGAPHRPVDRYRTLVSTGPGAAVARQLGLPRPVALRRYVEGQPLLDGPALVAGLGRAPLVDGVRALLEQEGAAVERSGDDGRDSSYDNGTVRTSIGALVLDATTAGTVDDLEAARTVLAPAFRRLAPSGRLLLLGAVPDVVGRTDPQAAAVQQALEGLARSASKEARAGATVNLVRLTDPLAPTGVTAVASTLRFLLSARSAYVSGQVVTVASSSGGSSSRGGASGAVAGQTPRPLAGQVAVVTGAARGIGAAIAEVLARDGAHVVGVDVPAAGEHLSAVAGRVGGSALALDVTAADAPARLAAHVRARHGGADVVVHNAGITRDRLLVNQDAERWGAVMAVNLGAPVRLTQALLDTDSAVRPGARVVAVSSLSGIAGNRGQTNYAASKAGVAGWVRALAPAVADRGVTANAVAPGFVETEMTARIPLLPRELGRRLNSLSQGGLPVDVAETIAWLADPASAAVTGQVVRVCGQSLLGA